MNVSWNVYLNDLPEESSVGTNDSATMNELCVIPGFDYFPPVVEEIAIKYF